MKDQIPHIAQFLHKFQREIEMQNPRRQWRNKGERTELYPIKSWKKRTKRARKEVQNAMLHHFGTSPIYMKVQNYFIKLNTKVIFFTLHITFSQNSPREFPVFFFLHTLFRILWNDKMEIGILPRPIGPRQTFLNMSKLLRLCRVLGFQVSCPSILL